MADESKKRSVGRPRLGKIKLILYVDPVIRMLLDKKARECGLRRSAYVEALIRRERTIKD